MTLVATEPDVDVFEDLELVNRLRAMFSRARSRRRPRIGLWNRNRRLVYNRYYGTGRPNWMASPQASEIFPILHAEVGWMTDQRQTIEVTATADPGSPYSAMLSAQAHDLATVIDSLWVTHDFDNPLEKVLWDAMTYGTGIFKTVWDPSTDGGMGNALLGRVDPYAFYPDPNCTSMDDMEFCFEARLISMDELERRFPGSGDKVSGGSDERLDTPEDLYGGSSQPMGTPGNVGDNPSTLWGRPSREGARRDGGVTVYECWLRENERSETPDGDPYVQTKWRFVVFCGNYVLMDTDAEELWGHGGHPYTRYVLQDLGEFWGMSLVEHLAQPQESLNRLLTCIQSNAELIANPVWLEDTRAQVGRAKVTNRPGQRLYKTPGAEVGWQTPPDLPSFLFNMVQFWISEMERISGLSAMVRGATPTNRASQGVLDQVQEAAFVRVRAMVRNLERSLRDVGELLCALIVENYTAPRIVPIVGPSSEQSALSLRGKHFYMPGPDGEIPMRYELVVEAGGSQPTSRSARMAEMDTALAMGAADRRAWLETHNIAGWQDIDKRMTQREELGLQAQGMANAPGARQRAGRS